jgi:hypothetical protein
MPICSKQLAPIRRGYDQIVLVLSVTLRGLAVFQALFVRALSGVAVFRKTACLPAAVLANVLGELSLYVNLLQDACFSRRSAFRSTRFWKSTSASSTHVTHEREGRCLCSGPHRLNVHFHTTKRATWLSWLTVSNCTISGCVSTSKLPNGRL